MTVNLGDGRRYSFGPVFFVALFFILVAPVFWRLTQVRSATIPEAYENTDLYQEIYPTLFYGFERVTHGGIPLWNPTQLCGAPFLANPRTGLFQPLNALFLLLPTSRALAAHAFVSLFLMGTFFSLFARSMGLRYGPALLGGVVYALCGASASAISRPGMAAVLVWSAFSFWAMREYVIHFRYRTAVAVGMGAALIVLSGANALAGAMLGLLALYGIFWCVFPQPPLAPVRWRNGTNSRPYPTVPDRFAGLLIAAAIGLAVSAAQWTSTLAWAPRMEHPGAFFWSFEAAGQTPLNLRELAGQWLIPRPGLLPHTAYTGLATLFLIPVALFCRGRWRDVGFFSAALSLACIAYLWTPKGNPNAFPAAALLFPVAFSMSILAAAGADRLLSPRGAHSPRVWLPMLILLIGGGVLFYASGNLSRGYLIAFFALILPAVLLRLRRVCALSSILLAVLLVTDLGVANTNAYYHPYLDAPACYERYSPSIRLAEEQSLGGRAAIVSGPLETGLSGNLGMVTPLSLAGAAHASLTRDQALWWKRLASPDEGPSQRRVAALSAVASSPALLNVMAVRALVVSPESPLVNGRWSTTGPRLREVHTESPAKVFVNEDALPRVYWVPQWRVAAGVGGALTAFTDSTFDATKMCVLDSSDDAFARVAENLPAAGGGSSPLSYRDAVCTATDITGERVSVMAKAPQSGILVLADSFAPGWKARLDGRPCPLTRANGLFRAVALPAGEHEVTFEYDPFSFEAGRAVSLASVTLLACGGIVVLARGRR